MNFIDPTGYWARATRTGNNVAIEIPIQFVGNANSKENIASVVAAIEGGWSGQLGKYRVRTKVRVIGEFASRGACPPGPFNRIGLAHMRGQFDSSVAGHGLDGQWDVDAMNAATLAHEAGHLLMLGDTHGGPNDLMETRSGTRSGSARPTEQMISDVLHRNPAKDYEW